MKGDYRPDFSPFYKNPPKAGGVFCFGEVGCSALRSAQGTLTSPMRTKYPPCVWVLRFQKANIEKIAEQFLPYSFLDFDLGDYYVRSNRYGYPTILKLTIK
jgi:hypothetical protein